MFYNIRLNKNEKNYSVLSLSRIEMKIFQFDNFFACSNYKMLSSGNNNNAKESNQAQGYKKQLNKYKEQAEYWRGKYQSLLKEHNQLLECLKENKAFDNQLEPNAQKSSQIAFLSDRQIKHQQSSLHLIEDQFEQFEREMKNHQSKVLNMNNSANIIQPQILPSPQPLINKKPFTFQPFEQQSTSPDLRSPRSKQQDLNQLDFFSLEQIQRHTSCENQLQQHTLADDSQTQEKGLLLISGYFILQKINYFRQSIKHPHLWVKACSDDLKKQTGLLEIIYRYTFRQQPLKQILDDPLDSRLNEIKYGTPHEEALYTFDSFTPEQQPQTKLISKATRKRYVHCLIRPQLVYHQGRVFQTQVIYGYISLFPFGSFFQEIHRTLQRTFLLISLEEIKYECIKSHKSIQEVHVSKDTRIEIVSKLMKEMFEYTQQHCSISNYPINISIQTKLNLIKLDIPSQQHLRNMQKQQLQLLLKKYNLLKIAKILHHVLTQKQIIVVALNRKSLNEILELVRLMIKPFYWVFPVVYRYSDHFEPFLSSPMPILIGVVFDFCNMNYKENKILMENEFVTIFVEQTPVVKESFFFFSPPKPKFTPLDLRQHLAYEKDIQFLYRYLMKSDKKSKSNQALRLAKYVNRLRHLVQSGSIDGELTAFMIDFLQTQAVQCYKEVAGGSAKRLGSEREEINEDMMMTR